jgi:hypothetical protein
MKPGKLGLLFAGILLSAVLGSATARKCCPVCTYDSGTGSWNCSCVETNQTGCGGGVTALPDNLKPLSYSFELAEKRVMQHDVKRAEPHVLKATAKKCCQVCTVINGMLQCSCSDDGTVGCGGGVTLKADLN